MRICEGPKFNMTPVLLFVFNRPECTRRVLEEIRRAEVTELYIVADGPRKRRPDDEKKCAEVRQIVAEAKTWCCRINTNFAPENLGCAIRVSSGISWAFKYTDKLIILEDDCLPHLSFFRYCDELLERYKDDGRVGQISGHIACTKRLWTKHSYTFSRYGPVWGWATWRRAWQTYDLALRSWPQVRSARLFRHLVCSREEYRLRIRLYQRLYRRHPDTWDYQWGYAKMVNGLLSVIPKHNLVENIGFSDDATHTRGLKRYPIATRCEMDYPLRHPEEVRWDMKFDRRFSNWFVAGRAPTLWRRIQNRIGYELPLRCGR